MQKVREALSVAKLAEISRLTRQQIGDLLIHGVIQPQQHSRLYGLLHNAWYMRRLELERCKLAPRSNDL